jgi:phosphoribosyl 1,2-cyclic phosphodiesterase
MRVVPIASGSAGNCTAIESGGSLVIVDAGISRATMFSRMRAAGFFGGDERDDVDALLLTHEHGDHAGFAKAYEQRSPTPIIATEGTAASIGLRRPVLARPSTPLEVAGLVCTCIEVPHDAAEPVAWRIAGPDGVAAVVTDLGYMPRDLDWFLDGVTDLVIEGNYIPSLLAAAPYPHSLRKRIEGELGHLSVPALCAWLRDRRPRSIERVWVGHLSTQTNHPAITSVAVGEVLDQSGVWFDVLDFDNS